MKVGKIEGDFNYYSNPEVFNLEDIDKVVERIEDNPLRCPSSNVQEMVDYVKEAMERGDSVGGVVELVALNIPVGVGNPLFSKLSGELAGGIMNINAVKGMEIGRGFQSTELYGSEMNDEYIYKDSIQLTTNNCGGILGGISCGSPLVIKVAIKPTPSISKTQRTINLKTKKEEDIEIHGRHDPIILPRAIPVLESVVAIVLVDLMIRGGFIHPCNLGIK